MALLLLDDIRELLSKQQAPCVSILFPTIKAGADTAQNAIRFKKMYRRTAEHLESNWMGKLKVEEFLRPAHRFIEDTAYWQDQGEAFGLFLANGVFRTFHFPQTLPEALYVGDHFFTKPLLPFFFEDGRFYLLAISQKSVRLFQGARDGIRQVQLIDVPQDIDEILKQYVEERHVEWHTLTRTRPAERGRAFFHGQGNASVRSDDKILQFFYAVNQGICRMLKDETVPMIFAGVDYLFGVYKTTNSYPNLFPEMIKGNPDRLSGSVLHEQARALLGPYFHETRGQFLAKYRQLAGTGHTGSDTLEILNAAIRGRIEVLFLAREPQIFGTFDRNAGSFKIHPAREPGDEDLVDLAASETFLNRGRIYELAPDEVPAKSPLAAIYRWPYPNDV